MQTVQQAVHRGPERRYLVAGGGHGQPVGRCRSRRSPAPRGAYAAQDEVPRPPAAMHRDQGVTGRPRSGAPDQVKRQLPAQDRRARYACEHDIPMTASLLAENPQAMPVDERSAQRLLLRHQPLTVLPTRVTGVR
jgi:hypothetical protein